MSKDLKQEQWEKRFDKEFCKVYPDGSSRFLRSVHENSDVEIKAFIKKTRADDKERVVKMLEGMYDTDPNNYQRPEAEGYNQALNDAIKAIRNNK